MLNIVSGLFSEGAPPVSPTSYESIQTVTVGSGGAADITFTSIPSTFKHLQVRWLSRNNRAAADDTIAIQFNGDTTSNYALHFIYGDGSAAAAVALINRSEILIGYQAGNSAGANIFGAGVTDILDYENTNKFKTLRSLGGDDSNGAGTVHFGSGLYRSSSAITSIKFFSSGANFAEYSSFALYGIKG